MIPNFLVLIGAALIPFFFAYLWYHPKVFGGDRWAETAGLTSEQSKNPVKAGKLALSILLNFLMAVGLFLVCVHQSSLIGMVSPDVDALKVGSAAAFIAEYGGQHLNFGHGMIHAFGAFFCYAIPVIGYVVIFERKSRKYLLVTAGFWLISMMLMGGVICAWGWQWII